MAHGAPSSSITHKWSNDVFLSFRGQDTRFSFTSHLHHALLQKGLRVFLNDEVSRHGKEMIAILFNAIRESRVAIVVFSENYPNSRVCLQELVQILKCFKGEGRLIYPVFYDVDPSELQNQKGSYAEALAQLEKRFIDKKDMKDQVEEWRRALSQAAGLSDYHHVLPKTMNADECIGAIVERVTTWMNEKEKEEKHDETTDFTAWINEKEKEETHDEITDFSLWEKVKEIGRSAYAIVYEARHRETGAICGAVKELNIDRAKASKYMRREIKFFSQLEKHPNVVEYYGHKEEGDLISIYMEYIHPRPLKKYILESGGKLDEPVIQNFTAQILFGLVHLHSNRRVHRDLKPDHLFVNSKNIVKLADFGLAEVLEESIGKHSVLGTLCYAAPELLRGKNYERLHETLAADIWSLGCVIIEMSSGSLPLWLVSDSHPHIPEELCQEGKDFLKLCFKIRPAERPTAKELLEDPFVKAQADVLKNTDLYKD